jgi:hypothetical protein
MFPPSLVPGFPELLLHGEELRMGLRILEAENQAGFPEGSDEAVGVSFGVSVGKPEVLACGGIEALVGRSMEGDVGRGGGMAQKIGQEIFGFGRNTKLEKRPGIAGGRHGSKTGDDWRRAKVFPKPGLHEILCLSITGDLGWHSQ